MPASKTARPVRKRGRPAKGGARRGKKLLASPEELIAAVESVIGVPHALMSSPLPEGAVLEARDFLFWGLRVYCGWTQKRICEAYAVHPSSVTWAQKKIRAATQNMNLKKYRPEMREKLDTIQFTCRALYHMSRKG